MDDGSCLNNATETIFLDANVVVKTWKCPKQRSLNQYGMEYSQRPISANPGLKVNLLFCFHTF